MNLFEMFEDSFNDNDFKEAYREVLNKYGFKASDEVLEMLSSLLTDPPPWKPWTK